MCSAPRPSSRRPFRPRRPESGATLVEYALLVAVLALGTIASITVLQDTAQAKIEETSTHIGTRRSAVTTTPPPPGGSGGSPITTTTAPPTTAPPTTAPPTTAPPTTAPPTTLPPATVVRATWATPTTSRDGGEWRAQASLAVRNDNDVAVSGAAVRMALEYRDGNGWRQLAAPFDAITTDSGGLVVTSPWMKRSGKGSVSELRFSVTQVTASGLDWEAPGAQIIARAP